MSKIDDAMYNVATDRQMSASEKLQVIRELQKALPTDRWTLRYIVVGLVALVILPVLFIIGFACWVYLRTGQVAGTEIPQSLVSLASTALGALAAYITRPRSESDERGPSTSNTSPGPGASDTGTTERTQ
jgi:hypothetical protein